MRNYMPRTVKTSNKTNNSAQNIYYQLLILSQLLYLLNIHHHVLVLLSLLIITINCLFFNFSKSYFCFFEENQEIEIDQLSPECFSLVMESGEN